MGYYPKKCIAHFKAAYELGLKHSGTDNVQEFHSIDFRLFYQWGKDGDQVDFLINESDERDLVVLRNGRRSRFDIGLDQYDFTS